MSSSLLDDVYTTAANAAESVYLAEESEGLFQDTIVRWFYYWRRHRDDEERLQSFQKKEFLSATASILQFLNERLICLRNREYIAVSGNLGPSSMGKQTAEEHSNPHKAARLRRLYLPYLAVIKFIKAVTARSEVSSLKYVRMVMDFTTEWAAGTRKE